MFNLRIKRINRNLAAQRLLPLTRLSLVGRTKASTKAKTGAAINRELTTIPIRVGLLLSSFTTSAKGCSKPQPPTFIGPTRTCINLNSLRSSNVKKATLIKTGSMSTRNQTSRFKNFTVAL